MTQPDIILIVLDTQRADRLGCYGYPKSTSPHLDHFASQSVLFEQAISPAQWTIPSHGSLFSGLYPTTHQLVQSSNALSPDLPLLAEVMQQAEYETVAFCNNPLVGVLNNGLKRGFDTFYNYGGAIPSVPDDSSQLPWPLNQLAEKYTQFLRKISYPVQNFFGQSDLAFQLSLNAWLTPVWSRMANFKGQNERSVGDVVRFLQKRPSTSQKPLFLFLNLMETHLPFFPPQPFIDKMAPYFAGNKEARGIMRRWNREAYRWAAPLAEPLAELESQVLSDLYDAEVAYQDDYLAPLLSLLSQRSQDTLTMIVSDHGDGLGEHGYFGHAFVAYQELVHVPLIVHRPQQQPEPVRIDTPVSTRRVYHTALEAIGRLPDLPHFPHPSPTQLSLWRTVEGRDPENGTAFSEVYPPLNFVRAIENRQPELLEDFRCLSTRRAVVQQQDGQTTYKLIAVDDTPDELFDLQEDALELEDVLAERPLTTQHLSQTLTDITETVQTQAEEVGQGGQIDLPDDKLLQQQLRSLGYLD